MIFHLLHVRFTHYCLTRSKLRLSISRFRNSRVGNIFITVSPTFLIIIILWSIIITRLWYNRLNILLLNTFLIRWCILIYLINKTTYRLCWCKRITSKRFRLITALILIAVLISDWIFYRSSTLELWVLNLCILRLLLGSSLIVRADI